MKPLRLFTNIFFVRKRTAIRCVGVVESKLIDIKDVCDLCTNKTKLKRHSSINEHIKRKIYTWITLNPQVAQLPIFQ